MKAAFTALRRTLLVTMSIASSASSVSAQTPPGDRPAFVVGDEIVFAFPAPYADIQAPRPAKAGYYAWRITMESEPKLSFVLTHDDPIATSDYEVIMRASTLRLCPSTLSTVAQCTQRIAGSGDSKNTATTITLKDAAIIARIKSARPEAYWRTRIEPGGFFQVDQVLFRYPGKR
jgi:hypothetical protein